jgi:type 1 glutamine amidotransferase
MSDSHCRGYPVFDGHDRDRENWDRRRPRLVSGLEKGTDLVDPNEMSYLSQLTPSILAAFSISFAVHAISDEPTKPARASTTIPGAEPKLAVLIVDGINNHDWERATRILKAILVDSGRFTVDVATSPPASAGAEQWQAWKPDFARYDVVVMNYNGGHTDKGVHWSRDLEKSLENYVSGGGGLVAYHAANNSFPKWPAYNQMIGLGWRDKGFGPSMIIGQDRKVVTIPKGQGLNPGHGPEHDFVVTVRDGDHPITKGVPWNWLHPHEQLTHGQHGPAKDIIVLTYAFSKDTKQNEVMEWVIPYGKGRVYTTMLGHLWKDGPDTAMRCVGFQTMFIRGVEWAASGKVTYPVPANFPTDSQIRLLIRDREPAPPDGHVSDSQPARDDKAPAINEGAKHRSLERFSHLGAIVGDYYHGDGASACIWYQQTLGRASAMQ